MYQGHRIAAFTDNYLWLLEGNTGKCAAVDPGDARPILAFIEQNGLELTEILLTHHHADHIGGLGELKSRFPNCKVYGPASERFADMAVGLLDGEKIELAATASQLTIVNLFGHTRDHIGYLDASNAFVGDTLFSIGCGRLFEGSASELYQSLQTLAQLNDDTRIYCAHEYTLANLAFALAVEPNHLGLLNYKKDVESLLSKGEASIPTTMGREKRLNPFLRCHMVQVQQSIQNHFGLKHVPDPLEAFTLLRKWKDGF